MGDRELLRVAFDGVRATEVGLVFSGRLLSRGHESISALPLAPNRYAWTAGCDRWALKLDKHVRGIVGGAIDVTWKREPI